jgi:signal transduction histidine kinase
MLRRKIGAGIELRPLSCGENIWTVNADASHLTQLITSLCLNARDAMPAGGILSLELANVAFSEKDAAPPRRAGEFVKLTASDTGKGMPPQTLARLLEHSFTSKEFSKGIGLGLVVVNSIVSEHSGWLEVRAGPAGNHFHVYFPRLLQVQTKREAAPKRWSERRVPGRPRNDFARG